MSVLLTMTGVDEKVSPTWIKSMQAFRHPNTGTFVEFGILRSPKKVGASPRYPTREAIERIARIVYPHQLAFHLCGGYADMVHAGEWRELQDAIDFRMVGRVQVNSIVRDDAAMLRLMRFSAFIERPVIIQWDGGPFPYAPTLNFLQDRSRGTGLVENEWFSPDVICGKNTATKIGYAGGLNPDNIGLALRAMRQAARGKRFWVDCESGVRTDDWFDTAKAEAMARAVAQEFGCQVPSKAGAA